MGEVLGALALIKGLRVVHTVLLIALAGLLIFAAVRTRRGGYWFLLAGFSGLELFSLLFITLVTKFPTFWSQIGTHPTPPCICSSPSSVRSASSL